MATSKVKKLFSLEVKARALRFLERVNKDAPQYICFPEWMNHNDFFVNYRIPHPTGRVVQAIPLNMDSSEDRYFMVYLEDCFDPPVAIVRAAHEGDAEEIFLSELPWADIDETDLADYETPGAMLPDGTRGPSDLPGYVVWTGRDDKWADTESLMVREVKLIAIDL